ncbi:hypothetical protein NQ315_015561 [Exocentrus adspersus]|uniref:Uncharacterized protein n=1 Tax=Exocentrus adspersus TaxID=1586481 RepID=A0AAV8VA94_9CUCU|nr:hypothetical protein NQ315_015561 [Exocentrus adspersus]
MAQEVTINGEAIQWSNNVKYLGVHLDRTMMWGHHVAETIRKAKTARGRLYPLLCGDSRLNLRNKLLLIKSVIQPQLTYASTAWGHACNTHLNRIQAVENIALRTATSAPWFVRNRDLYRDLEWTPVQEVIKVKAAKVYAKATDHENPLLRAAVDYEPDRAATHKRPKQQLLDPGSKITAADREQTLTIDDFRPRGPAVAFAATSPRTPILIPLSGRAHTRLGSDSLRLHNLPPTLPKLTTQDRTGATFAAPVRDTDYPRGLDEPAKKQQKTEKRQKIPPSRRGGARTGGDPSKSPHQPDLRLGWAWDKVHLYGRPGLQR